MKKTMDAMSAGTSPEKDREAMARYPSLARLWAREAVRTGDLEGMDRAAEVAMAGLKLRPPSREVSRCATGFEKEDAEASVFLTEMCSHPNFKFSKCMLSQMCGSPELALERLLTWASSPRSPASFTAAALGRGLRSEAELETWIALAPLAKAAAERTRLTEPVWAKELSTRAMALGAHDLAEELGGPKRETGVRMADLAKALVALDTSDELHGARVKESLEVLRASDPELLKRKEPLMTSGGFNNGINARDPLNWGCDDEAGALALRAFREGVLGLSLGQRGKSDLLALGMIFIHGDRPESLREILGVMKDRGAPLDGMLGARHHLQEHKARWRIDAGRPRGKGPSMLRAQSLFEAALLKGADWAKEMLIEAGHPRPKMAKVEKWLARWKDQNGSLSKVTMAARVELLAAIRIEHEAWCLEAETKPAAARGEGGRRGPRI